MEEYIKILEEIVEIYRSCSVNEEGFDMMVDIGFTKKECEAIENLIKGYRELEERTKKNIEPVLVNNKMYFIDKELYEDLLKDIKTSYIVKSKVKEKIEELEELVKDFEEYWSKDPRKFKKEKCIDYYKLETLQELLGEE